MPLRVLLLLPEGVEQPSSITNTKHPKSPSSPSFASAFKLGIPSRPSSRVSNNAHDYRRSKPLPSPPPIAVSSAHSSIGTSNGKASNPGGGINRASHLTIPSTSGSSAGSSTEFVPSPPLSPSPTNNRRLEDIHDHDHAEYAYDEPEVPTVVRGLKLNKNKGKGGARPVLVINTKLPKTGRGVRYLSSQRRGSVDYTGEDTHSTGDEEAGSQGSTSRANDDGAATARRAVDDRLHHLLATTGLSPAAAGPLLSPSSSSFSHISVLQRISQISYGHGRPTTPAPLPPPPPSPSQAQASHTTHARSSNPRLHNQRRRNSKLRGGGSRQRIANHSTEPPPPPTRTLAPYRIFGAQEPVPLDVVSDPRRARRVNVKAGWSRAGIVIHSTKGVWPKGTKGKYIRLITLPPLPPSKITRVKGGDGEEGQEEAVALHEGVVLVHRKGRMPTVLIEHDEYHVGEDGTDAEEKEREREREKAVPTVFMTELVAAQFDRPIPCMMYPPPPPNLAPSSSSTSTSTSPSASSSRRGSTLTSLPTSISTFHSAPTPFQPTSKTYQLPLPLLTPHQKSSLHAAGLLVYAVPTGYTGVIPPPECVRVGGGEEVVPPWVQAEGRLPVLQIAARGRDSHASGTMDVGGGGVGSPRGSTFGFASPIHGRSPLGLNAPSISPRLASPGGDGSSEALSPRWPVEGLWSRARGYQRNSNASATSGMSAESPMAASRPVSGASSGEGVVGDEVLRGSSPIDNRASSNGAGAGAGSGWSSSFSSIRARAQGYYAKDGSAGSTGSTSPSLVSLDAARLSSSKSEISTSSAELASTAMSRGTSNSTPSAPMNTSRSFGSLFLRTPTSNGTSTSAISRSASSPLGSSLSTPEAAPAGGVTGGEVLFEFVEPPRDGEVVKVEIIETDFVEPAPVASGAKGWKGWGSRWGG